MSPHSLASKVLEIVHSLGNLETMVVITMGSLCPIGASRVPVLASIHALHLVRILVKLAPEWLCSQRSIVDQLIEMWRSQKRLDRLAREEELSQIEVLESKVIAKCLLNFINAKHEEVSPLLEIVSIFVVSHLLSICAPTLEFVPLRHSQDILDCSHAAICSHLDCYFTSIYSYYLSCD